MNRALDLLVKYRVAGGVVFALLYLWVAAPRWWSVVAGLMIALAGAAFRVWASGHIAKRQRLATTGPYSLVRNPLYAGSFVMGLGACVMGFKAWVTLLYLVVFAVVYSRKVSIEEMHLARKYGPEYEDYLRRVPRFLPLLRRPEPGEGFDWQLVLRHREYQAWLGLAAVTAALVLKIAVGR